MCGDLALRRLYYKRDGTIPSSLYAETGYRNQWLADRDYEFRQSQTDIEESRRTAQADGRFALSVCAVPPGGGRFPFGSNQ